MLAEVRLIRIEKCKCNMCVSTPWKKIQHVLTSGIT